MEREGDWTCAHHEPPRKVFAKHQGICMCGRNPSGEMVREGPSGGSGSGGGGGGGGSPPTERPGDWYCGAHTPPRLVFSFRTTCICGAVREGGGAAPLRGDEGHGPALAPPTPLGPKTFFAVLDLEATCWESDKPKQRAEAEVIELPTVLYRVEAASGALVKVDEWREYVRPQRNPQLTPFCTQLTGIAQATVDGAAGFPAVLQAHAAWLRGATGDDSLASVAFVTCGDWDLAEALPRDVAFHGLAFPAPAYSAWVNIKREFLAAGCGGGGGGRRGRGMVDMLSGLGLALEGRHHSGLDDSRNIGRILEAVWAKGHRALEERRLA
jgi:inhibitor of KinA sporulation pathway (predicted exonuclease)